MTKTIGPGALVEHRAWGRGKVIHVTGDHLMIHFASQMATEQGPVRKLQAGSAFVTVASSQSDPVLDLVPIGLAGRSRTRRAGDARPARRQMVHGLEHAIAWFEQTYPKRFEDPELVDHELGYKRDAHKYFVNVFGGGKATELLRSGAALTISEHLKHLYHATNIPSRFEVMAANDGLGDGLAAARLLETVTGFLDRPEAVSFQAVVDAIASLPAPPEGSRVLTWPNATILPFLADPMRFMVLKPQISRRIASRMQVDLLYSSPPNWHTYEALLRISQLLRDRLAPLGARDFIDVQSFMWVTQQLD